MFLTIGAVLALVVALLAPGIRSRRNSAHHLGFMSAQWLAEHRASHAP